MSDRMNVAVVGAGDPHNHLYVNLLRSFDDLVDHVPLFAESIDEMAHHEEHPRLGPRYVDLEEMLKHEKLDAAILLVPHDQKPHFTGRLCGSVAHVLCEKSAALDANRFEEMIASAGKHKRRLSVCYPWRNNPAVHDVRRALRGELGPTRAFEMRFNATRLAHRPSEPTESPKNWTWLRDHSRSGGGILAWLGVHWIDLAHDLFGPAAQISAMIARYTNEVRDVEENAHLTMLTEGGAIGTIRTGWILPDGAKDIYIGIEAEHGAVRWSPAGPSPTVSVQLDGKGGEESEQTYDEQAAANVAWIGDFVRQFLTSAVCGEGDPMISEDDGLYVMRVLDAAYESVRSGRTISL